MAKVCAAREARVSDGAHRHCVHAAVCERRRTTRRAGRRVCSGAMCGFSRGRRKVVLLSDVSTCLFVRNNQSSAYRPRLRSPMHSHPDSADSVNPETSGAVYNAPTSEGLRSSALAVAEVLGVFVERCTIVARCKTGFACSE